MNEFTSPLEMDGRVCLITGANSGIGKATAAGLADMGARVLMVCRDRQRGEAARDEIRRVSGNDDIDLFLADLGVQASVRALSLAVLEKIPQLNVLINNAGVLENRRSTTADGLDTTFAVNHLGYFLLTNLLLDLLKAGAPGRIVNVSSGAHMRARINFDDLQSTRSYSGWQVYGQSKLANVLFTYELARRLSGTGVTANAVHPGVVATNFGSSSGFIRFGMRAAGRFMLTPEQGADTVLYLACSPDVAGVTGRYFVKRKAVTSSPASRDAETQRRLWQVSAELTGLEV